MRIQVILFLFIAFSFEAFSESGIKWINNTFDFGLIEESDGLKNGECRFVNTGDTPLIITGVRPGCGCTSVEYPEEKILPGDTAVFRFTYDPEGRPGKFEKSVKIYLNKGKDSERFIFTGTVKASESTLEKRYPYKSGALRYENETLLAGELHKGMKRHFFVSVYNTSEEPISIDWESEKEGLEVKMSPSEIKPGEGATLNIYLDTVKIREKGFQEIEVTGHSDADEENTLKIKVAFNLL